MLLGLVDRGPRESVLYGWFRGPIKSLGSHGSRQSVGSGEVGLSLSASPTHLLLEVGWLTKPLYTVQFDFGGFQRLQFL